MQTDGIMSILFVDGGEIVKKWIQAMKIVVAAVVAILIASALQLDFAISAGIVTILTIQPTKKETIRIALGRLCAFVIALLIAFGSFWSFGYNLKGFFVYLLIYITICQFFSWNSAMAMNSVLISHFVTFGVMNPETLWNESLIFVVGVGCGIAANLHLRKQTEYIERLKNQTDAQIVKIVKRMSERIMDKDISDYNGHCFRLLREQIREAQNAAKENYNNQFGTGDRFDMEYIAMRERQCQVLFEMYKSVRELDTSPSTAGAIADFLKNMAEVYDRENDCNQLMSDFNRLEEYMRNQPLPTTRKEFEDRARLFGLMRSMEEFIEIKRTFTKNSAVS